MHRSAVLSCIFTAALIFGIPATPAPAADSVAEFYRGKSISLVIGFGPGGGYDSYPRVLARHLGKHIPGNPSIVPQNMSGAGGLAAPSIAPLFKPTA